MVIWGHVGTTVTSHIGGLLLDIEVNDTTSPAIKHRPSKQLRLGSKSGMSEGFCLKVIQVSLQPKS